MGQRNEAGMSLATVDHSRQSDSRLDALIAHAGGRLPATAADLGRTRRAGPPLPRRRRHVQLADRLAAGRLAQPRRAAAKIYRRRRHGVRRPARRLRRLARRPRPPGHRRAPSRSGSTRGTHFAQPTEDAIVVAEELSRRFGLPAVALRATPAPRRRWTPST